MVKITVEIPDEDAEIVAKGMNVDVQKLVESTVQNIVAGLKEVLIAKKAGIPLTMEDAHAAGLALGKNALETSRKKD